MALRGSGEHGGAVLVVEDEPLIRLLLEDGLSTEGYEVKTAANADEAISQLEGNGIDVILLDLMLPGCSGVELARHIRGKWPIYIIAMSASPNMLKRALDSRCVDRAVSKPFDWDTLVQDLDEVVSEGAG